MRTGTGERSTNILEALLQGTEEGWFGAGREDHRVYLYVPYREKGKAKALGAFWDPGRRQWYFYSSNPNRLRFARWIVPPEKAPRGRVHLVG